MYNFTIPCSYINYVGLSNSSNWSGLWPEIVGDSAEAECNTTPMLWPPNAKNWLTGKDPDAGKDWRQEEKGMTGDEMVGWRHWLDDVWVNSGSSEWTRRPGMLQSTGLQRVRHDWATELTDWWPESLGLLLCLALSSEVDFHIFLWITSKYTILPWKFPPYQGFFCKCVPNVSMAFFLNKSFSHLGITCQIKWKKILLKSLWYGFLKPGVCKLLVPPSWMILV